MKEQTEKHSTTKNMTISMWAFPGNLHMTQISKRFYGYKTNHTALRYYNSLHNTILRYILSIPFKFRATPIAMSSQLGGKSFSTSGDPDLDSKRSHRRGSPSSALFICGNSTAKRISLLFVLLNMFLAIINDTYSDHQGQ